MPILTDDQVAHFQREGWLAVPDYFSPIEVVALQREVSRLQGAGLLRNVATAGDGRTISKTVVNLQICPVTPASPLISALKYRERTVDTIRQLVGDPVVFRLDQIFLKPGMHGAGTKWHQDNAYWHQPEPTRGTGMWIAVHEATRANGTMHIVPRSHVALRPHERDLGSDHHVFAPAVRDEDALPIELPAGGVLFFNFGILHCTHGNKTTAERAGLALHFINGDYTTPEFMQDFCIVRLTDRTGARVPGAEDSGAWEAGVAATASGAAARAGGGA